MDAFFKTPAGIDVTATIRARVNANMIFFLMSFTCYIVLFCVAHRIKLSSVFTFAVVGWTALVGQCWISDQIFISRITSYIWARAGWANLSAVSNVTTGGTIVVFVVIVVIAITLTCAVISITNWNWSIK